MRQRIRFFCYCIFIISNLLTVKASAQLPELIFSDSFEALPFPPFIPPDPAIIAPPVDETVPGHFGDELMFLCTATEAVQRGGDCQSLQPHRIAALRGRVFDGSGIGLPGVLVRVPDHPEYGYTFSRADGVYDLAVNGGGEVTVELSHPDYLPAQRGVAARWQQYERLPDVHLVQLDSAATNIRLGDPVMQVHRANPVNDADGNRQATLLFPPGLQAVIQNPDGSQSDLVQMTVRATEYTVGDDGPQRMPADLPESSGYTYAVELSSDEALASGADRVVFDQPVWFYVENFLDFPTGEAVPSAYYEFQQETWLPSANGRIIAVIAEQNGLAQLDIDGDAVIDDPAALAMLGITSDELAQLGQLYEPGQTLWRVPVSHFTPWDYNWPYGPPPDAEPPPEPTTTDEGDGGDDDDTPGDDEFMDPDAGNEEPDPSDEGDEDGGDSEQENPETEDPTCATGSIIECENRALGESIAIPGTDFSLTYRSSRSRGGIAGYQQRLRVPLAGATVPPTLLRASLDIRLAGVDYPFADFASLEPFQTAVFGAELNPVTDRYGRAYPIRGSQVDVRLNYWYQPFYYGVSDAFENNFGFSEGIDVIGARDRRIALSRRWTADIAARTGIPAISAFDARAQKLGGWTLSEHHVFDARSGILWRGDGIKRNVRELSPITIQQILPFGATLDAPVLDFDIGADGRVAVLTDEFFTQRLLVMDPVVGTQ